MHRRTFIPLLGGAVAYWPFAARAQRPPAVIGYLNSAASASYPAALLAAFRQGLGETGYIEGKNLAIEYRWAENRYERLPELATQLVERPVAVIAATGGLVTALAAKNATKMVPIVVSMGDDPVFAGVVPSFSRPGGKITGVSFFVLELGTKLLDLATELLPGAGRIALLANPSRPSYPAIRNAIDAAARTKGCRLVVLDAASEKDFEAAFESLTQAQANALLIT